MKRIGHGILRIWAWSTACLLVAAMMTVGAAAAPIPQPTEQSEPVYAPDHRGYRYEQDGWIYLHIEGAPEERGYQHGYLLAEDIERSLAKMKSLIYLNTGVPWDYFKEQAEKMWLDDLGDELTAELSGIARGANDAGIEVDLGDLLTLNGNEELVDYWWPHAAADYYKSLDVGGADSPVEPAPQPEGADDHCSSFIATGSYTKDGGIVVAHNSFTPFELGAFLNVVIDVSPQEGAHFVMQSQPGFIHSMSDYYSTERLIITETTIGGFNVYDPSGIPEFVRIRNAVQYAASLDDFTRIMLEGNNGGYANTWLVGDITTHEIMRFELGLKFHAIDKTTDGAFVGFNAPLDPRIRNFETSNSGFADIRRHQGARQVRLPQLMAQYKGEIDEEIARIIIADHVDVYLNQPDNPNSRTVCAHYELDAREYLSQPGRPVPYQPRGTVDGVVGSSNLAKRYALLGRWGNSCGMPFDAEEFLAAHPQFDHLRDYLIDRPSRPWTTLSPLEGN